MGNQDDFTNMMLDEYRVEELLGHGGMARVYRGFDTRLHRYVAIKVIDRPFRADQDYIQRFEREAQAIARLDHPHIVKIFRFGEAENLLYMAMQYVEGSDLGGVIDSYQADGEYMEYDDILRITRELCMALDYAHQQGVIHRDVKPSNVMLNKEGKVILTDFGLALQSQIGTAGEIFGSPHYLAPEQAISSANVTPQSDLYAVGVMLFEMFTNTLPFDASEPMAVARMHMTDDPPAPRQFRPELSEEIEKLILRALAKEPNERYQTGAELGEALATAIAQKPSGITTLSHKSMMDRVEVQMAAYPLPPLPPAVASETEPSLSDAQPAQGYVSPSATIPHPPEFVATAEAPRPMEVPPSAEATVSSEVPPTPEEAVADTQPLWTDNRPDLSAPLEQPRWFYGVLIVGVVLVGLTLLIGLIYAFSGSDDDEDKTAARPTNTVTAIVLEDSLTLTDDSTAIPSSTPFGTQIGFISTSTPLVLPPTALPQPTRAPSLTSIPQATQVPPTPIPPTPIPPIQVPPTNVPPSATNIPSATPVPPTNIPPTDVPPTDTPLPPPTNTPTITPTPEEEYSFKLLIQRETTPGSASLLIANHQVSTGPLDLSLLRIGNDSETVFGSYWNVPSNQLNPNECLALYVNPDNQNLPSLKCEVTYTAQFPIDRGTFWTGSFDIAYDNYEFGTCFDGNQPICQIDIEEQPPHLTFVRLEGNKGVVIYNLTGQDIQLGTLQIYDDKDNLIGNGSDWGLAVFPQDTCLRLWKNNELKGNGRDAAEQLSSAEDSALDRADVDCVFIAERIEIKNKEQFWTNKFSISWGGDIATCPKNEDVCQLDFGD